MIGRGLRLAKGKDLLLVVDFQWLTRQHQLLMEPTLLLLSDELPRGAIACNPVASDR